MENKQIGQSEHNTALPKIKWSVSKHRRDKRTGPINPVKPSKYYKALSKGVGWCE